ncbi:MAG: peptidoglycan-binding protein [Clostridia bacterium]|nr:peptidoglycan-binding protein [Clostridia bacterium]
MAYIDSTNEAIAILQIQRILRALELLDSDFSSVPLSGVYENETRGAVAEFQAKYGLESTGVVDYETWVLLHKIYDDTSHERNGIRRVQLVPNDGVFSIIPGQKDDIIYVIQYMLSTISTHYDDFGSLEYTGIYDEPTQNAIKVFQRKNLIDATGIIDASTLEALFEEYEGVILERG